jgi:hypothetical protein
LVFGVPSVGIAERLGINSFEVGEVTLVVESFAELQRGVSKQHQGLEGVTY